MAKKRRKSSSSRSKTQRSKSIWTFVALGLLLLVGWFAQRQGWIDAQTFERLVNIAQEEAGIETGSQESEPAADRQMPPPVVEQVGDGALQAFFTTPYLVYPDVAEERTPPAHEQAILADIDAAQSSIDFAVFEYNLMSIADALIRAQEREVAVRLALDKENLEKPEMEAWIERVEAAGIPVAWQDATAFLHSKYIIVDNNLVWMGSWNATENDTYRNNNNLLRITAPAIVENYAAEFSQMSEGVFGNSKESLAPNPVVEVDGIRIENYFSPKDSVAARIVERLQAAQGSIRFLAFSYTSDEIAQAMIDRHEAGVVVQGVFEARNAHGTGAEFERLEAQGIEVFEDGNCYTMHHKVIIIDEQTVITGSYNFSKRAEDTNDENLVMIDSAELARQFLDEFERVYGQAQAPTQCGQ